MKSILSSLVLALSMVSSLGFAVRPGNSRRASMTRHVMAPAAVDHVVVNQQHHLPSTISPLQKGVQNYLSSPSSSSQLVSLKERHIPTAEEIAEKKRNFNIIFWGGGFVAPFLATIFYFGFRFWEK